LNMFAVALLVSPLALLAPGLNPALRSVGAPLSSRTPQPAMILGGNAGKSVRRALSSFRPLSKGKMPRMCDGADGGDGGEDTTPAPEPSDDEPENPLVKLWKSYETALDEKPLLMKALTSFTGFAIGDILAQIFIQKGDFDFFRLFRMASFGFLVHGTTSHWFYGKLDGAIPGKSGGVVAAKVFIDQVLWNPIFGVMFFGYVALLEAKGLGYVIDKTKNELLTQVTGSWKVWPLAHTINFRYVPSSQRVLYINTIQIGYNCFLSLIANREK